MKRSTKILLRPYSVACIQVQSVLFSNQAVADVTGMHKVRYHDDIMSDAHQLLSQKSRTDLKMQDSKTTELMHGVGHNRSLLYNTNLLLLLYSFSFIP